MSDPKHYDILKHYDAMPGCDCVTTSECARKREEAWASFERNVLAAATQRAPVEQGRNEQARKFIINHCKSIPACSKRGIAPFSDWPLCDDCIHGIFELEQLLAAAPDHAREGALPTVDEIAEAMADARLWRGSWNKMCDAERDVMRQGAEGVHAMLVRRALADGKEK